MKRAHSPLDDVPWAIVDQQILTHLLLDALVRLSRAARRWRDACAVHLERRQTAIIDALPACYIELYFDREASVDATVDLASWRRAPIRWTFFGGGGSTHWDTMQEMNAFMSRSASREAHVAITDAARFVPARARDSIIDPRKHKRAQGWFGDCIGTQCACWRANGVGCIAPLCACHDGGATAWRLRDDRPGYLALLSPTPVITIDVVTLVRPSVPPPRDVERGVRRALGVEWRVDGDDTVAQRWSRLLDGLDRALTPANDDPRHTIAQYMANVVEPLWNDVDASFVGMIERVIARHRDLPRSDSILLRFGDRSTVQ